MRADMQHLEAELLKALGHPVRLQVLQILARQETCVCELIPMLNIEQSNLSQHLKLLRKHGIVQNRREGSRVVYSLVNSAVIPIIAAAEQAVQEHLNQMAALATGRQRKDGGHLQG